MLQYQYQTYLSSSLQNTRAILSDWKTQHIFHFHYRIPELSLNAEKYNISIIFITEYQSYA